MIDRYLASQAGSLACEQIVGILEQISASMQKKPISSPVANMQKRVLAGGLRLARWVQPKLPGSHNRPEFQRHRFPGIPVAEVRRKLKKFQALTHTDLPLKIEPLSDIIFKVYPAI